MYFVSAPARERIVKDLPGCKIICSFRDPVERAYSNYRLLRRNAFTKAEFERAAMTRGDLLESNRYGTHLAEWFNTFGPNACWFSSMTIWNRTRRVSSIRYAILSGSRGIRFLPQARAQSASIPHTRNRQTSGLRRTARGFIVWLAARGYYRAATLVRGSRIIKYMLEGGAPFPPLTAEVSRRLREYYRPEVQKLEKLIGRDLSAWKSVSEDSGAEKHLFTGALNPSRPSRLDRAFAPASISARFGQPISREHPINGVARNPE